MKLRLIKEEYLMEMANLRGKDIKIETVNFSIYFSPKGHRHGIKLKVLWNRDNMKGSIVDGILELHGNYKYTKSTNAINYCSEKDIDNLRNFAKKYKVIFAGVWENALDQNDVQDYFKNRISLKDLLNTMEDKIPSNITNLSKFEKYVRENQLFNMND